MKTENNNEKITDLTYLKSLSKGNEKFVKDMLAIFLEENPREVEALRTAIAEKNYPAIKASAHKLKSTTPFVGINKIIGNETVEVEKLAGEQGDLERIIALFGKIDAVCAQAVKELNSAQQAA